MTMLSVDVLQTQMPHSFTHASRVPKMDNLQVLVVQRLQYAIWTKVATGWYKVKRRMFSLYDSVFKITVVCHYEQVCSKLKLLQFGREGMAVD